MNDSTASKFFTSKFIEVNDLSGGQYSVNKNIGFKTRMLRSDLCDYIDAHILMKGTTIIKGILNADTRSENLTFKNKAPFISYHAHRKLLTYL